MTTGTVLDRAEDKLLLSRPEYPEENGGKDKKRQTPKVIVFNILFVVIAVIAVAVAAHLLTDSIATGANAAMNAFGPTKDAEAEKIYNDYYNRSFSAAEAEYHVRNQVMINIGSVQEKSKLEVLRVSAVEYVIDDGTGNDAGVTSWLEATGTGVFTVDLAAGEYLVDNERHYVLVRLPEPEFTNASINHAELKLYKDNTVKILGSFEFNNGSTSAGEELAQHQREEAYMELKEDIASNQRFYQSARTSAENLIINLIKELNRDIPDLVVDIEFV